MITDITFVPGDTVKVYQKIKDGEKFRLQTFQGTVLSIRGRGENKTFTVSKTVGDVGVERIWPVFSPMVDKVMVVSHAKKRVKKAKLYNLRVTKN